MLEQANVAIETSTAQERRNRELKYARRNKMRYIDKLLNELEMLNLAEQDRMPRTLSVAVEKVIADSADLESRRAESILEAMDLLYEIQDSLMYNQIEDE